MLRISLRATLLFSIIFINLFVLPFNSRIIEAHSSISINQENHFDSSNYRLRLPLEKQRSSEKINKNRVQQLDPPANGGLTDSRSNLPEEFPAHPDGLVEVIIELNEPPAVEIYAAAKQNTKADTNLGVSSLSTAAVRAAQLHLAKVEQAQQELSASLSGSRINATIMSRTQRVYNGISVQVEAAKLDEIRSLPGVKAIHPVTIVHPTANAAVPFIGTPTAWTMGTGFKGDGIKIGIIDSGIDYLHTDFGGPGSGYANNDPTRIGDAPNFPGPKVAGGYDFVGDDWNPTSSDPAKRVPRPDPDPMDCGGHGTAVASLAAGYGVNADGTTYRGAYDGASPFSSLRIGPGVAPGSQLYALKITTQCLLSLSTDALEVQALEWAVDPNGDGDFSDHLDIVNSSNVGSAAFDVAMDNASLAGMIIACSAGNGGDSLYYNMVNQSVRALLVAASVDPGWVYADIQINSPSTIAGQIQGLPAEYGPSFTNTNITAEVVSAILPSACSPLTNAANVSGKIALIDVSASCPGVQSVRIAQNAGAVGVIFVAKPSYTGAERSVTLDNGTGSDIKIPSVLVTTSDGDRIKANLPQPGVSVTLTGNLIARPDLADTVAIFSSRGPRRGSILGPDIAAPGDSTITAAKMGTGQGTTIFGGTSGASPFVAGAMALLKQMHSTWSVEELKALIMNTATFDLFAGAGHTPPRYGLSRMGAGRVALQNAIATNVIAYNADAPGLVSVSFGALEVASPITVTKNIIVVNKGKPAQNYSLSYNGVTDIPGVTYSILGSPTIRVPANGSASFQVQLSADPTKMKHSRDATVSAATPLGGPRQWISEAGGYVTLTPNSGPALRVPVYAVARPASRMGSTQSSLNFAGDAGMINLGLAGQEVNTGNSPPTDEISIVTPFELQDVSPKVPSIPGNLDIKNVGITNNYKTQIRTGKGVADTVLAFGVSVYNNWSSPAFAGFVGIFIDTNGDGIDDYEVYNSRTNGDFVLPQSDVFVSAVYNLATGVVSSRFFPLNNFPASQYDTVPFNTSMMVLPVFAADLGLTDARSKFTYQVKTQLPGVAFDKSRRLTYDVTRPGLDFGQFAAYADLNGNTIPVQYSRPDFVAAGSLGILLLHHHNESGKHEEIVSAYSLAPTSQSFSAVGGTDTINVIAPDGGNWTAVSNDDWISMTAGATGTGNGTVAYSVAANSGSTPRTGSISIAGQTFTVNQASIGPSISSAVFDGKKKLIINGMAFGSMPHILINGIDKTDFVISASDTGISMKGKAKKLGLKSGNNLLQVIDSKGAASNTFILMF